MGRSHGYKTSKNSMASWRDGWSICNNQFEIVHRQGWKHANADALSRHPCHQCGRETHGETAVPVATVALSIPPFELRVKQLHDKITELFLRAKEPPTKPTEQEVQPMSPQAKRLLQIWDQLVTYQGLLYRQYYVSSDDETITFQLVVPACMREEILKDLHEGAFEGHLGGDKTFGQMRERFYWPG